MRRRGDRHDSTGNVTVATAPPSRGTANAADRTDAPCRRPPSTCTGTCTTTSRAARRPTRERLGGAHRLPPAGAGRDHATRPGDDRAPAGGRRDDARTDRSRHMIRRAGGGAVHSPPGGGHRQDGHPHRRRRRGRTAHGLSRHRATGRRAGGPGWRPSRMMNSTRRSTVRGCYAEWQSDPERRRGRSTSSRCFGDPRRPRRRGPGRSCQVGRGPAQPLVSGAGHGPGTELAVPGMLPVACTSVLGRSGVPRRRLRFGRPGCLRPRGGPLARGAAQGCWCSRFGERRTAGRRGGLLYVP